MPQKPGMLAMLGITSPDNVGGLGFNAELRTWKTFPLWGISSSVTATNWIYFFLEKPDLLSESIFIFVVSTTGSGVEPRSMTPLWQNLLRSDLPPDAFQDLLFSVFGLGDSGYEKFCWVAKKLSRRMVSLGAVEFYERGEGDEQHALGSVILQIEHRDVERILE